MCGSETDTNDHQKRTADADPLGDALGIIDWGTGSAQDDIVSARWLARRMAEVADAASLTDGVRHDPNENVRCVILCAAEHFRWAVALHDAWVALQGDCGSGCERAGDLYDVVDLFLAGRGTIQQLAIAVRRGDYRSAPRHDDGALILDEEHDPDFS
jgi:hypothetical protein